MNQEIILFTSLFFVAYILLAFVLPSIRVYRRTGVNPVTFGKTGSAHDYVGSCFKVLLALLPLVIFLYWLGPTAYAYILPAVYLHNIFIQLLGIALCVFSFLWTLVAQRQMGMAWRIGLDNEHRTELVQNGLFRISRNPIFLGMIITLLGFFLILPNSLTLVTVVTGYLLIQIQIRLEEEHLEKKHGDTYRAYIKSVRRII